VGSVIDFGVTPFVVVAPTPPSTTITITTTTVCASAFLHRDCLVFCSYHGCCEK